ncbi:MAG: hypothetical protein N4A36_03080 [Candidatus Gracilibacteria bacterium]|nr:hypothetical protein [Candidatus Gracilibacteria bacterium]
MCQEAIAIGGCFATGDPAAPEEPIFGDDFRHDSYSLLAKRGFGIDSLCELFTGETIAYIKPNFCLSVNLFGKNFAFFSFLAYIC